MQDPHTMCLEAQSFAARLKAAAVTPLLVSLVCLFTLGCSSNTVARNATIAASPNPVPDGTGPGTTTVTWNTGDGSWGQAYLFLEGQPEQLFSEGPSGSQVAPWISTGPVYEFRLYAGKEHAEVLASVSVTRSSTDRALAPGPSRDWRRMPAPQVFALALFAAVRYAALGALVLLSYALGRRLTLRWQYDSALEQFVFCTGLGLGSVAILVFLIGVLGLLYQSVVVAAIVALVLACGSVWKEPVAALRRWPWTTRLYALLAAVAASAVLFPVLMLPLYPPTAWDATMYHLPYAKSYVQAHHISPVLGTRFPVFPQANEMLFTLALLLADDIVAQLTQFLMMVLVCLALFEWGSRRYSARVGMWAAALWLANSGVWGLAGAAFIDLGVALFATLSVYATLGALSSERVKALLLAGAFAGLAAGSKYFGLYFVAALGLSAVCFAIRERRPGYVVAFGLAALATGAPWYLYNAYHSGNPVFPFLAGLFGTGYWSAGDVGAIEATIASYRTEFSLTAFLRLPWDLSFGDFPEKGQISPVYFAALPALLIGAVLGYRVRGMMLVATGFILFWFMSVPVVRYLLPILPVLGLAVAAVFEGLIFRPRFALGRAGMVLAASAGVALAVPHWQDVATRVGTDGPPPATREAREQYLEGNLVAYRAYRFANEEKGSAYTLYGLYGENMLYFAEGTALGDWFGPARYSRIEQSLGDGQRLYRELRVLGADLFLVQSDRMAVRLPEDQFFRSHFKLVYAEPRVQLFELADVDAPLEVIRSPPGK